MKDRREKLDLKIKLLMQYSPIETYDFETSEKYFEARYVRSKEESQSSVY